MSQSSPSKRLKAEQETILYQNSFWPIVLSLCIACLLVWHLYPESPSYFTFIWLVLFTLITLFRLRVASLALRSDKDNSAANLYKFFVAGVLFAAACWGAAPFVYFPQSPTLQTIFITCITGICAGAVSGLCSSWLSISSFLCLSLLPLSLRLFMEMDKNHFILGGLTFLFLLVSLFSARKLHISIKENILLRLKSDKAEKQIEHQARYDDLTNLPNRRMIKEMLDQEISRSQRHAQIGALLILDIDHFKTVNDSLGHGAGDQIIRDVASRITTTLRKEDITARLGGDEFAVLLQQLDVSAKTAAQKARIISAKISHALSTPFEVQNQTISLTQSIGISLYPEKNRSAEDIIKQADTAMNQAKTSGRNTVRFFFPDMQQAADTRLQLHSDIKKAIENDEFSVHFQPQVQADGTIVGAEGLLRWQHPERGLVPPAMFIPVAEESALIIDIGACVLHKVCTAIRLWEDRKLLGPEQCISMNISAKEFSDPQFVDKIIDTIGTYGIAPQHLGIELTESSLISSVEETINKIEALRKHGIKFSVDDFGTGYSSLSYLKSLPLHTLKIDRAFVQEIEHQGTRVPLVEIIITMARNLGLEIVAEGVETAVELKYLAAKGCKIYQGYYFYKPMPGSDFTELLEQGRPLGDPA